MSNFYVTTNILVEELHQFTRIEAVLLAQIDEEFAIAFGRSERLALFTFTPFFLFTTLFSLRGNGLYLWGVSIVS